MYIVRNSKLVCILSQLVLSQHVPRKPPFNCLKRCEAQQFKHVQIAQSGWGSKHLKQKNTSVNTVVMNSCMGVTVYTSLRAV